MRSSGAETGKAVVVEMNQALRQKAKTHADTSASPVRLGERALVDRLRSGDPSASAVFYETHHPHVRRFIGLRLSNATDADDLTQETFERAYRSIHGFQGRSSLRTWLLGIARHVCSNYYRSSSRWMIGNHPMVSPLREESADARIEDRVDTLRSLERCLEIVDKYRDPLGASVFRMRFIEGLSIRAIASRTGMSSEAVKKNIGRSRRAIAQYFGGFREFIEMAS
jgi:RNA polymerase sigma-70 factor (ECF subfamily)